MRWAYAGLELSTAERSGRWLKTVVGESFGQTLIFRTASGNLESGRRWPQRRPWYMNLAQF